MNTVKRSKVNLLRHLFSLCQPFMGSVGYFLKSNLDGLRTIWQHWVKTPFSDIGAALSIVMAFLSGLILYRAKNKNLDKTFDFLYSTLQTILAFLTLSVVGFASATISAIAISGMALNIAYSLGGLIYSFYKYRKCSKDIFVSSSIRQSYKKAMFKYGTGLLISAIVLTAFLVVSVFFPYVAAAVSLSIALTTSAMLLSIGIYKVYKFFCLSGQQNEINHSPQLIAHQNVILSKLSRQPVSFEYYYVNNRLILTGDSIQDRKTLILVAYEKIVQLEKQIYNAQEGVGKIFWSQEAKRQAKLDFLKKSLVFLLPSSRREAFSYLMKIDELTQHARVRILTMRKLAREPLIQANLVDREGKATEFSLEKIQCFLNRLERSTYQSFFRKTGEIEGFIQALESYFENLADEQRTEKLTRITAAIS